MPSPLAGKWTLKQLVQLTYQHFRSRYKNMKRDVIKSAIRVYEVKVYDGKNPGEDRTKYLVKSSSYPQYKPYFTGKDKRGRTIKYQRTVKHQYDCTIQIDKLSLNVPCKLRTGADRRWQFSISPSQIKSKKNPHGKYLDNGDYNSRALGNNGDFFFRLSWVYQQEGILFGRNFANRAPVKTNPKKLPFLDKHMLFVVTTLAERGVFKE